MTARRGQAFKVGIIAIIAVVAGGFYYAYSADLDMRDKPSRDAQGNWLPMVHRDRPGCRYHGFKSAITGQWVTEQYASQHPDHTYHICVR
jgi:hypothetical protein